MDTGITVFFKDTIDFLDSFEEIFEKNYCEDVICIDCSHNKKLKTLPDLSSFVRLKRLCCNNCSLTSLPHLSNINLCYINCSNNSIEELPYLNLPNLSVLKCNDNLLMELPKSLKELPKLQTLECSNNFLLNLANFSDFKIEKFICHANPTTQRL